LRLDHWSYRRATPGVAYGRVLKHGGRHAYCRGDVAVRSDGAAYCRWLAFGGRPASGGRLGLVLYGG